VLDTISRDIRFYYKRGVQSAEVVEGDRIRGQWANVLDHYTGKTAAGESSVEITKFANCPADAESVRGFTLKYGPLDQEAVEGEPFTEFYLTSWRNEQRKFRDRWRFLVTSPKLMAQDFGQEFDPKDESMEGLEFRVEPGEEFRYRDGCLHYRCLHLLRFMQLDLLTTPFGRLRVCANKNCLSPYFIASDLRMRYCGLDECLTWGKRQSSLSYWKMVGNAKRKARKSESVRLLKKKRKAKGTSHASKKTARP
jgi:hypothetical protein